MTKGNDDIAVLAAAEFEPVGDMEAAFSQPAWGKRAGSIGINLRLAATMVNYTKPQLAEMGREIGNDSLFDLIDCLTHCEKDLKALAQLANVAGVRLLVVVSLLALEKEARS